MAELELVPPPEDEEPITTAELRATLKRIEEEARVPEPEPEPEPEPQPINAVRMGSVSPVATAKRIIRDAEGRIEYIIDVPVADVPMPEAPSGEAQ